MEPSGISIFHKDLSRHPLFKGFSKEQFSRIKQYYQILAVPEGAQFLYPGDTADSLFIILEGEVFSEKAHYFKGDFWGLGHLTHPDIHKVPFTALRETVLMRLRSEAFRRLLKDSPGYSRCFKPENNADHLQTKGVPRDFWKDIRTLTSRQEKKGSLIHYKSRSSRKTFSLSLTVPVAMILAGLLLAERFPLCTLLSAGGLVVLLLELFLRNLSLYKVTDKAVVKRYFNFRGFRQDQQIIPIDQIQTVVISTKGVFSKIFRVGDLEVQTAGKGLVFCGIDNPGKLQKILMDLKNRAGYEEMGREKEGLRQMISERFAAETADRILYRGDKSAAEVAAIPQKKVFRKSPWILVGQLFFPCLIMAGLSVVPGYTALGSSRVGRLSVLVLILIALLRVIWLSLDWWNDIYMIKFPQIWDIERKPFGKEDVRKQTELGMILNVTSVQKGLLPLLLNFGNVEIETAGRGEPLVFYSVKNPYDVQDELLFYREYKLRQQEGKRRTQAREDFMALSEILEQTRNRDRLVRQRQGLETRSHL